MESMKEEVEEVLETLRPMLMQDGGNVELVDIDAVSYTHLTLPTIYSV